MELFAMGSTLLAGALLVLLGLVLLLNVFGLPGNWIMLILVAVYRFVLPVETGIDIWYWVIVVALGVLGEVLEFFLQVRQAKRYGSSGTGTVGGVIGALIGAVLCAPILFGLGAFLGALAGAYAGCLLFELLRGQDLKTASRAALGAMFGRFLGTVCKLACGAVIWAVTMQYVWPDPAALPYRMPWLPPHPLPVHPGDMTNVLGQVLSLPV